jgi:hypothetical protein
MDDGECRRPGTSTTVAANVRACGAALHRMQRKAAATACTRETQGHRYRARPHVPMRPCILQVWVHITYYATCAVKSLVVYSSTLRVTESYRTALHFSSTVNLEAARIYYLPN